MSAVCVFCAIAAGEAPAEFVEDIGAEYADRTDTMIIRPLGPQVPGHVLVIPRQHVANATEDLTVTSTTMAVAADYASLVGPCNIITSVGAEATQSVFHLHVHVLPRGARDGLRPSWPWVRAEEAS